MVSEYSNIGVIPAGDKHPGPLDNLLILYLITYKYKKLTKYPVQNTITEHLWYKLRILLFWDKLINPSNKYIMITIISRA